MRRLDLFLLCLLAAAVIFRVMVWWDFPRSTTAPAVTHPTSPTSAGYTVDVALPEPLPDFDYRSGEWLEGFCARTSLDNYQTRLHAKARYGTDLDKWKVFITIQYPERIVTIDCEQKKIKIDRKSRK